MVDPVTGLGIGMKALGWVASPIISELFKKCSTYLSFDASEKLRQLGPKLILLERAMEVFDKIPGRDRLEKLFEDLKSAFYEAEDILDDVEYHCLEKEIHSMPPRKRDWVKKLLPSQCLKIKETGMPKKELKDSLEKIEGIINTAYKFVEHLKLLTVSNVQGSQAVPASSGGLATTAAPPPIVIGRDKERDQIIAMLHEKEGDDQLDTNSNLCYSVIGIHGIGGSGKSTLAQLVCDHEKKYKQEKRDGHFDLVMWVHVSQNFSVDTIFKEMFEAATGHSCAHFNNLNTLQDKLEEKLHGKRFLLVLDDIWCNIKDERQQGELRKIVSPLKAGEVGSKVLVTSRSEDALLVLGAIKPTCIPIPDLDAQVFHSLLMHYALEGVVIDDHVRRRLSMIGADIAKKLKGSPLAARIVGRRLGRRPKAEFWVTVKNGKLVDGTMGALWWSYQHLDQQARRCFAYCSIFPRRRQLYLDELIKLWVAEGFIRTPNEREDVEDVGREYFDELASTSFLQKAGKYNGNDYYLLHDLVYDLAEMVAGSDCFRIENGWRWEEPKRGVGWRGDVPLSVRYLFVQNYDAELITKKILKLKSLRTLIIDAIEMYTPVEEKVIASIFKKLQKLRVLTVGCCNNWVIRKPDVLYIPEAIIELKHLRYLAFRTNMLCRVILPNAMSKLYHMQLLDFGECKKMQFSYGDLIKLRHVFGFSGMDISNIGRLTSLQTIPSFIVRKEQGYEVKQLRGLNKLHGRLSISGLENIESKEEALEANLAGKEQLTQLVLYWGGDTSRNPEVQAEVLEGLCPPVGLETLHILGYEGSKYPNWMVSTHSEGPNELQELWLYGWSQHGPAPELEAFAHLCSLELWNCTWFALPCNMKHLMSLKRLLIDACLNIRSLPTLPLSLEEFTLKRCNVEFVKSCETHGHPNWQKIEHVPMKSLLSQGSFRSHEDV
ncbi:hypothetical protein CFC21_075281 [Triticum aestivum]|uniref:NB-ARC domain-containing protein n=2 Tax=Triticum aestivum TaxID=4565 RepID=A0A9R1HQ78_WHEAT|nr:putative disease resistance protein RGA1 isoform X1 [Triticum aestivum]KAF7069689.1 hypothetical protein CFC21_075281 [Triticum aestivum]